MIIRLENDPKVIVQPDQTSIIYTGTTITSAIGSGATTVTVEGQQMIIYTSTGGTATWGDIYGTLADQTDLKNALDVKLNITDFNTYTGDTQIVLQSYDDDLNTLFNDVSKLETYTGETETRLTGIEDDITTLDGQVVYLSGQTDLRLEITDFNTYTGATETELNALETDKLETTDFNTYTGQTETELLALDTEFDNYVPSSGGTFTGKVFGTDLQLSGTLTANKITSVYTENVLVKDQYVYLRSGATTGLGVGEIAGVAALNVDSLGTTAIMGVTNDGIIRVGWSGDTLQAVATREDSPVNLGIATWSNALDMYVTTGLTMPELQGLETDLAIVSGNTDTNETNITALETDFNTHTGDTDIHYAQSAITITESQVSGLTADLGDKLDTTVYATYTGETETRLTGIESDIDTLQTNVSSNDTDISNLQTDVAAKADKLATINTISTSQNIVAGWSGEIVEASGTITLTFPTGLDNGFQLSIVNTGTGIITIAGATGVTLRSKDSAVTIANQYEAVSAYVNNDIVTIVGGLT